MRLGSLSRGRTAALMAVAAVVVLLTGLIVGLLWNDEPVDTVFVGDSITAGFNPETIAPDADYSWVTYAVADDRSPWQRGATVAEFGVTLGQMATVFEGEVLSQDPEAVVIMGGTNDAFRDVPIEESTDALRSMVTSAQDDGIDVWVVAPPPMDSPYGQDLQPYVDAQAELAEELDVPYVDVRADLSGPDGSWASGLASDGIHPSEEGARRIADLVLTELDQ